MLHLYTSPLEDPDWDLGHDVEAIVLRRSRVRLYRYRRSELRAAASQAARSRAGALRWRVQTRLELYAYRARRIPQRLTPARVWRSIRVRARRDRTRRRGPPGETPGTPALVRVGAGLTRLDRAGRGAAGTLGRCTPRTPLSPPLDVAAVRVGGAGGERDHDPGRPGPVRAPLRLLRPDQHHVPRSAGHGPGPAARTPGPCSAT